MAPTVGLVVPVYNNLPYLEQMLASISNQTRPFDEVVIVDDASPDPLVLPLLRRWTASNPNSILIECTTNGGIGRAQQKAVDCLLTDFVAFLDCDDWLAHD